MAGYNGSGVWSYTYNFVNDANNGIAITASRMDGQFADSTGGFNLVICRDGQSTTTAAIPFAGGGIKTDTIAPQTASGPIAFTAGQIGFPAAQNPSANVNTLDDYEEGTFTPTISFGGGSTGVTYSSHTGTYTKVGNNVSFRLNIVLTSTGSSTGSFLISGLPFADSSGFATAIAVRLGGALGTINVCQGYVNTNASTITLESLSAGTATTLADTSFGNTAQINLSGTYQTT